MTWDDIGRDNLHAGRELLGSGRWRSCVSRSYYAVFSAVVGKLEGLVRVPKPRFTPRHEELVHLILKRLTYLYPKERQRLANIVKQLRRVRIRADYDRKSGVGESDARQACRVAAVAFKIMKVSHA